MRVSTSQMHETSLAAMLDQQSQINKTQLQLSTGRRILTPADDPTGSAQVLDLSQQIKATDQYQKNADAAQARLALEEGTLTGAGDLLERVRTLAIQANNDTQTNETRVSVSMELRERLDELLGLANTRDANGEYLFSGFRSATEPFSRTSGGGFAYDGDQGQRYVQIGPANQVAIGDAGTDVFVTRNGNGTFVTEAGAGNTGTGVIDTGSVVDATAYQPHEYTISFVSDSVGRKVYLVYDETSGAYVQPPSGLPDDATTFKSGEAIEFDGIKVTITGAPAVGDTFTVKPSENQDLFTTVQNLIDALERPATDPAERAKLHNEVGRALSDLDQGIGSILETRAKVGARLSDVETQKSVNDEALLQLQTVQSDLQDVDYAEAITRFNQQLVALQAAQQTYVKVQGLSLFSYL